MILLVTVVLVVVAAAAVDVVVVDIANCAAVSVVVIAQRLALTSPVGSRYDDAEASAQLTARGPACGPPRSVGWCAAVVGKKCTYCHTHDDYRLVALVVEYKDGTLFILKQSRIPMAETRVHRTP